MSPRPVPGISADAEAELTELTVRFIRVVDRDRRRGALDRSLSVADALDARAAQLAAREDHLEAVRLDHPARRARSVGITWARIDDLDADDPSPEEQAVLDAGGWGVPDDDGRVVDPTSGDRWWWRRAVAHERRAAGRVEAGEARCAG